MKWIVVLVSLVLSVATVPARGSEKCVNGYCFDETGGYCYQNYTWGTGWEPFDIVIIGDGYTTGEIDKFLTSAKTMTDELWNIDAYSSSKCSFNVWLVPLLSNDSGIEITGHATYGSQDTALDSEFVGGMVIETDFEKVWKAVEAAGLTECDFVVVLVNDPSAHDGATAYHSERVCLITGNWPWGVSMAHELGHLISDLGDEYPCLTCNFGTGYLSTPEWNRDYATDHGTDIVDNPNLTIDASKLPWATMVEAKYTPTMPTDVWEGSAIGAWEGGGHYRTGVWRSEEYCVMDGWWAHSETYFCDVCRLTLEDDFASCVNDCTMVRVDAALMEVNSGFGKSFKIPFPNKSRFEFEIPPCYACGTEVGSLFPPSVSYRATIEFERLPEGSTATVRRNNGVVVQMTAPESGDLELHFDADTLERYWLIVEIPPGHQGELILTTLKINDVAVDL